MCSGLILVGMMMTVSRTVIVALAAIFLVLAVARPKQRLVLIVAALTMAVIVHMFFPGVIGTFIENLTPRVVISQETSTTESRLADYPRILARVAPEASVRARRGNLHARPLLLRRQSVPQVSGRSGLLRFPAMLTLLLDGRMDPWFGVGRRLGHDRFGCRGTGISALGVRPGQRDIRRTGLPSSSLPAVHRRRPRRGDSLELR